MSIITIFIILLLIILSAFISAAETSVVATSPGNMQRLRSEGNIKAMRVLGLLKTKEKVISTLLIVINFANIISATIATSLFIEYFGENVGTVVSSIVMGLIIIIFAEIIPKEIAVAKPDKFVLMFSAPLVVLMKIFRPINVFLHYIVRGFCFIFRIDLNQDISGEEEIRGVIEHHMHEGNVYKDDRDMLGGILDIRNMLVSDIMIHRSNIIAIDINIPIDKLINIASNSNHTRLPIWEEDKDNIIGILHVKNLMNKMHNNKNALNKKDILNLLSDPVFVPDKALVMQQLQHFREGKTHIACVVNEYGDLQGIVTFEDILEEIVGQIYDEHDTNVKNIVKKSANEYIIDGSISIRDLNRELGWRIPESDATTLAGFMINEMEKIPNPGDFLMTKEVKLVVTKKSGNRVKTISAILQNLD